MDDWLLSTRESTPRWVAVLSDGSEHYQDDGRPDTDEVAWIRLRDKCRESGLFITDMYLVFRSHTERREHYKGADGYWFRFGVKAGFGVGRNKKTKQINSCLIGVIRGQEMSVDNWRIPELIIIESDVRSVDINDETIIWSNLEQRNRTGENDV